MKLFIDSADAKKISELVKLNIFHGITTTPTFFWRLGISNWRDEIRRILDIYELEVHIEALGESVDEIVLEALKNAALGKTVVSKIPMSCAGLEAAVKLHRQGVRINMHLIFSLNQAVLAALAGCEYICPLIGRLNDAGNDGHRLIKEIVHFLNQEEEILTKVMASSIRNPDDVRRAVLNGVDAITIPPEIISSLFTHPLTDKGYAQFVKDCTV